MLALHDEVSPESSCLTFGIHFFLYQEYSHISVSQKYAELDKSSNSAVFSGQIVHIYVT